jgi:hypothetical protein
MSRTAGLAALVALLATDGGPAVAEGLDPTKLFSFPPAEFLEKSYIVLLPSPSVDAPGPGGESYRTVFEGQLAPHLFFYNDLDEQAESGTSGHAFAVSFTYLVRVRLYDGPSFPLRTPSMNPRITGQYFYLHRPTDQLTAWLWSGMLGVAHHSNGQEWCPFQAGVRDRDDACTTTVDEVDVNDVNLENGSFSTNYVTVGAHVKYIRLDDFFFPRWTAAGGLVVEIHPQGFGPGAISSLQSYLYGAPLRPRLELEVTRTDTCSRSLSGAYRFAYTVELFDGHAGAPSYRTFADASRTLFRLGGVGLFARVQSGQDNYNINFVNRIDFQALFGLTWDPTPPPHYSFADGGQ